MKLTLEASNRTSNKAQDNRRLPSMSIENFASLKSDGVSGGVFDEIQRSTANEALVARLYRF